MWGMETGWIIAAAGNIDGLFDEIRQAIFSAFLWSAAGPAAGFIVAFVFWAMVLRLIRWKWGE